MLDLQAMVIDRAIGTKARRAARGGATRSAQERRWRRGDPRPFKARLGRKPLHQECPRHSRFSPKLESTNKH
jgi:hypothetical protein